MQEEPELHRSRRIRHVFLELREKQKPLEWKQEQIEEEKEAGGGRRKQLQRVEPNNTAMQCSFYSEIFYFVL
jgi:hypothetical protein